MNAMNDETILIDKNRIFSIDFDYIQKNLRYYFNEF